MFHPVHPQGLSQDTDSLAGSPGCSGERALLHSLSIDTTICLWQKHISNPFPTLEHRVTVQPDNQYGSHDEHESVPGLGIGKGGVHHLEVIQGGD